MKLAYTKCHSRTNRRMRIETRLPPSVKGDCPPAFTKLTPDPQTCVNGLGTEFHKNPSNALHTYGRRHKVCTQSALFFLLRKERLSSIQEVKLCRHNNCTTCYCMTKEWRVRCLLGNPSAHVFVRYVKSCLQCCSEPLHLFKISDARVCFRSECTSSPIARPPCNRLYVSIQETQSTLVRRRPYSATSVNELRMSTILTRNAPFISVLRSERLQNGHGHHKVHSY